MNEHSERLKFLLNLYADELLGPAEESEMFSLMNATNEDDLENLLKDVLEHTEPSPDENRKQRILQRIWQLTNEPEETTAPVYNLPVRRTTIWRRIAAAAAIIVIIGAATYFMFVNKPEQSLSVTEEKQLPVKNDIAPGKSGAALVLADGRQISLDSATNGKLASQGEMAVLNQNGLLVYNKETDQQHPTLYNTLSTSRGETYPLVLADGSKLWLNSASSVKFPVAFTGNERRVEITGEVYFEVAKDASKPFTVMANDMEIQVLGTHFNVNAYNDEPSVKTTLLEGSVKVKKGDRNEMLKPGQQAQLNGNGDIIVNRQVDTGEVMAWKNGLFQFNDTPIESIMRQVSRWYNVDVVYEGKITQSFNGKVPRNVNVSEMFKILEATGWVKFTIEGGKIKVQP